MKILNKNQIKDVSGGLAYMAPSVLNSNHLYIQVDNNDKFIWVTNNQVFTFNMNGMKAKHVGDISSETVNLNNMANFGLSHFDNFIPGIFIIGFI